MPRSKTVYLFRCGDSGLYAYTSDRTGRVLPSQLYSQIRWRYERRLTLQSRKNDAAKRGLIKATLDAVAKQGFHLMHAAIQPELHDCTASARHVRPRGRTINEQFGHAGQ